MSSDLLLDKVKCGSASEIMMAVRYNTSPPGPTFIPSLDDVLLEYRPHDGNSSLRRGDLIEVVGPSGSGKSALLTFLLMTTLLPAVLPPPLSTVVLGGKGGYAQVFQPDTHRSIIMSLRRSIGAHIRSLAPQAKDDLIEDVIKDSLSRLSVWKGRPRWKDLALGLKGIVVELSSYSTRSEWRRPGALDLVVIDGFADGYYPQLWADEERGRKQPGGDGANTVVGPDAVGVRQVMEVIGQIRKDLGSVVAMSVQGLRTTRESQPFYLPHLPSPYPNPFSISKSGPISRSNNPTYWPLNIQITLLGCARGLQLPGDITLIDALRSKARERKEKGEEGQDDKYEGLVRLVNVDGGILGKREGAKFHFHIGENGLQVWNDP
ncbi:hypothetical protein AYX15_06889 [Cryptococcus neoformans]|nr:hypothetical protein AYX15_06889 [Cryptococcus neoformans var. grubii]